MTGSQSAEILPRFARLIERRMGLHFTSDRFPELEQKIASLARQAGDCDLEKYLLRLMSAPLSRELVDILAPALTIGETYFLRDPESYRFLEEKLLPKIVAARRATDRTLRIWSAGCSSGEEPYSIAILLHRAIPDLADWKITLLATDINPVALERGRRGVYSHWSFRIAPPWLMDYFSKCEDGRFEILPRIREMVRFSHLNLADEEVSAATGGRMDIIFCRNVMLYFEAAQIKKTMAMLHASLSDEGWLFVGPTDVDHGIVKGFSCRQCGGASVLTRIPGRETAGPAPSMRAWGTATPADKTAASAGEAATAASAGETAALAEKSAAAPILASPPAPAAKPSAAPAPAGSLSFASSEGEDSGAEETTGSNSYAQALALYQAGRYLQAAERALSTSGAGGEQASALALGARAYANIGRFSEAQQCCEKAIACDRLNSRNHYLLSIILEQQGDRAGAVTSLKHALYIDHDYLLAYFSLGNLYRQCGEERESERCFANALRLLEKHPRDECLPEAEGMTAGSLAQMIRAMSQGMREAEERKGA